MNIRTNRYLNRSEEFAEWRTKKTMVCDNSWRMGIQGLEYAKDGQFNRKNGTWDNISWSWVLRATLHRFRCHPNGYNWAATCRMAKQVSVSAPSGKSLPALFWKSSEQSQPARVSSKKLAVGKSTGLGQRVTYLMLAGLSLANVTWMTWAHLTGMERFEMASRFKAPMMHRCGCSTMSMQHCSNMLWIHLQNQLTPQILILSQILMLSHKPT